MNEIPLRPSTTNFGLWEGLVLTAIMIFGSLIDYDFHQ